LAEEKKDVIVPSAGNEKLQPVGTFGTVKKEMEKQNASPDLISKFSNSQSVKAAAAEEKKEADDNGRKFEPVKIPPTEKKSPTSGPPVNHRGIKPSRVNDHIKNSSFGRGVPFSKSADYGSMWKNTSRLASVAIGNGNAPTTKFGLYPSPFNLTGGMTMQGFAFEGAVPMSATNSTNKGMGNTFHLSEDEDE